MSKTTADVAAALVDVVLQDADHTALREMAQNFELAIDRLEDTSDLVHELALIYLEKKLALVGPCKDGQLPDGPVCPECGGLRARNTGFGGYQWVHIPS